MKKKITLAFIVTAFLLASCEQLPGIINDAKRKVPKSLIDPSSAIFNSVYENKATGAVCGLVNSKNRMGGYAGATPFTYHDTTGVTFVRDQPKESDFERYFQNFKYAEIEEYLQLENKCKKFDLWEKQCGAQIYQSDNKYCQLIIGGKSLSDLYDLAKPILNID